MVKTVSPSIVLDPSQPTPLISQLVEAMTEQIHNGTLLAQERLPSIRRMAALCNVSPITVANAYTRLVSAGLLDVRDRGGYYVKASPLLATQRPPIDSLWLLQHAYEDNAPIIKAGCGWLAQPYIFTNAVKQGLKALKQSPNLASMLDYGSPYGLTELRRSIRRLLAKRDIPCVEDGIILTHGASQALELVLRALTQPDDTVLVDDPGYCNLYPLLQSLGLKVIGIARTPAGPSPELFERAVKTHQPKLFVTTSILHNPTGSCVTSDNVATIHALAVQHGVAIIEDNIFLDLTPESQPCHARYDKLQNIIHISSFSKTIAPGLRVGYLACAPEVGKRILRYKMAASLTSAGLNEATVLSIIKTGQYGHHLTDLRERLFQAQKTVCQSLVNVGMTLSLRPMGGLFAWARFGKDVSTHAVAERAAADDILLAPGSLFRPERSDSQWFRFNVTHSNHARLYAFLEKENKGR
ncbi:GntR family transcriptional regulator [Acetobacter malorum DSM 14337]|uniref:GntR family transcriptional regulator n=1 Tax=Acetobacter malorum DSM 14337 TaxID=1307910 RepID=A0ABQ0PPI2_9PROT|nr:PLP-dependent aminotransferase family protein [Acetobacter malorum]KXV06346.1 GntR family transcriptional regulator [Acetobacter malorum]GBQ76892.1 GntR family transcriptional regulator [Acetobacter malorum DSM 14337]